MTDAKRQKLTTVPAGAPPTPLPLGVAALAEKAATLMTDRRCFQSRLHVKNISFSLGEAALRHFFAPYGVKVRRGSERREVPRSLGTRHHQRPHPAERVRRH